MIHVEPQHYKIIQEILRPYQKHNFHAFGSRVTGKCGQFSDLDLCVMQPIPPRDRGNIEEALRASRLPYKVDIIDWTRCSEEFRNLIKNDLVRLDL
ncbi:MAG: uncharacterized protein QG632_695 [Candidatus Dependentiae bacterium]|nr:uncharacterized protein [Candidatus Dependentiae bacterium]